VRPHISRPKSYKVTATTPLTNSRAHIIGGTFDGTAVTAYAEGLPGKPQTGVLDGSVLTGQLGLRAKAIFLAVGSQNSKYLNAHVFRNSEAQFSSSDLILFDTSLSGLQMASITSLLRSRIGP